MVRTFVPKCLLGIIFIKNAIETKSSLKSSYLKVFIVKLMNGIQQVFKVNSLIDCEVFPADFQVFKLTDFDTCLVTARDENNEENWRQKSFVSIMVRLQ